MANKLTGVELNYGAMADSIASQLKKKLILFDKQKVSSFQKMADAITLLKLKGVLTDKESVSARNKLHTIIERHIIQTAKK